jgi:prepilin-type N-terminal cleavage/methylation domain-containing protein
MRPGAGDHPAGAAGVTLLEVMVALAIMGILASISGAGIMSVLPEYRLSSAIRGIHNHLQLARLEAVKRNTFCTMAFVNNASVDYILFVDENANLEWDSEPVLARKKLSEAHASGVRIDTSESDGDGSTFLDNGNGYPAIAFNARGIPADDNGGLAMGTIYLTNDRNDQRSVVMNAAGRLRIE